MSLKIAKYEGLYVYRTSYLNMVLRDTSTSYGTWYQPGMIQEYSSSSPYLQGTIQAWHEHISLLLLAPYGYQVFWDICYLARVILLQLGLYHVVLLLYSYEYVLCSPDSRNSSTDLAPWYPPVCEESDRMPCAFRR